MRCRVQGGHDERCDRVAWTMLVVKDRSRDGMERVRRKAAAAPLDRAEQARYT